MMKKDDILKKSREENRRRDERETAVLAYASQVATSVGGLICAVMILLEAIILGRFNSSVWTVYLAMVGTTHLVKYIKLGEKHELLWAIVFIALTVLIAVMYALEIAGVR